ncbi:MAG: PilZ domain-containing protein [Desulfosporosinus sp.]|nr:PilZ domain-containing protein [Desulfosporosinus sp.]
MSNKEMLLPGLAVDIVVEEGDYGGEYRTRIEEVEENTLSVGAPLEHGELVPLREGTKVKLIFWDKVAAYTVEAIIVQRIAVPISIFVLELTSSVTKVQRRNYVRVPALFPLTFEMVTREGLSDRHKAMMLDLSGGGMQFLTETRVEKTALLNIQVTLPNGDLRAAARVSRAERTEDRKRYLVSVEFDFISERERDRIIRCVFDIQRAMRKKGLV